MFCCCGLGMSIDMNFMAKNKSSSLLSGFMVPREMEYDSLAGLGDLLTLS